MVAPMPPIRGGIAAHSAGVANALRAGGADVRIVSWRSQYPQALYRRPERDGFADTDDDVQWILRWWDPVSLRRAADALTGVELVIVPWAVPVHAVHLMAILRSVGVPYAVHVHNVVPHEPIPGALRAARSFFGRAARLVTHADALASQCRALVPGADVTTVPMPPHLPAVVRPMPEGAPRLLCLGYLRDYKGTDVAIEAMAQLAAEGTDATLTIAGEPWDGVDRWRDLVERRGLEDRVRLDLRYVPDAEVAELIADHHVFVAPYRSATQSGIVPQALAAGRPVVASDVGGLPELVAEGHNGSLAAPGDAFDLARAMQRTLGALATQGSNARESVGGFDRVADALVGRVGAAR